MSHGVPGQFLSVDMQQRRFTPRVQLYIPTPNTWKACTAWYSAEHLSSLYANNDPIESWPDESVNNRDLTTLTSRAPLFKTGILNGYPAALFDGTNDRFVAANDDVLWGSARTGTVIAVYKVSGAAGGNGLGYLAYTGGAAPRGCYDGQATSPGFAAAAYDGNADVATQVATAETWHVGIWTISGGSVRGGVDNPDTSALASAVTGAQTGSAASVLIGGDGVSNHFKGYLAELAFFSDPLTEIERQSIVSYFCLKYGLPYPGSQPIVPSTVGGWTDVGEDVVSSVKVDWGIHGSSPRDRVAGPGTMKFDLDNSTANLGGVRGYYSPGHAGAKVGFRVGVPVRLLFFDPASGDKVKWQGSVESIKPSPGAADRRTSVGCVDWMEEASRAKLSGLAVQVNTQADELFNLLIAASSKQPPLGTSVGSGSDVYPFALDNVQDESSRLIGELQKIAASEFGYVYVEAGVLNFESRQSRSGTSSIKYALDEDTNIVRMSVSHERDDVINRVQVAVHPRRRDAAATTQLFQLGSSLRLDRNTSATINCPYRDPNQQAQRVGGVDMVAPVATTDYLLNTSSDGSGSDITSQLSIASTFWGNAATLVLTNDGPLDGFVTFLRLRGRGLYDFEPVISDRKDDVSVDTYGENAFGYDMAYQASAANASDLAHFILTLSKDPRTRIDSVTFVGNWDEEAISQAFNLRISDRISVTSPTIGLSARPYFVNGFRMDISSSGLVLVTLDLAPVDTVQYWVLEVPGRTELDLTTVLGYGLFVAGWILDTSQLGTDTFLN